MAGYLTRFAPSPTGRLHLGHAFSALTANDRARAAGGSFLLRIEDTDTARCKPAFTNQIFDDLRWLGLDWPEPVLRQSDDAGRYAAALARLTAQGLCYACHCTRGDIRAALSAPQEGVAADPIYPGTCRSKGLPVIPGAAIRLDLGRALEQAGTGLQFAESGPEMAGRHQVDAQLLRQAFGDVVLARRDTGGAAYHLAVVVDDSFQGITEVVRGMDLFTAAHLHVLLHALLEISPPDYHHHRLIRDDHGKRLAKRDDARSIAAYRTQGLTPAEIRRLLHL